MCIRIYEFGYPPPPTFAKATVDRPGYGGHSETTNPSPLILPHMRHVREEESFFVKISSPSLIATAFDSSLRLSLREL